jgi:hypothetical protein
LAWWLRPIIPATQEAETGRIEVPAQAESSRDSILTEKARHCAAGLSSQLHRSINRRIAGWLGIKTQPYLKNMSSRKSWGCGQILLTALEGQCWILHFWPPDRDLFLWFKVPRSWCSVTAAPGKPHRSYDKAAQQGRQGCPAGKTGPGEAPGAGRKGADAGLHRVPPPCYGSVLPIFYLVSMYHFTVLFLWHWDWNSGPVLARQALYDTSHTPSPFCFTHFSNRIMHLVWADILLFTLPT